MENKNYKTEMKSVQRDIFKRFIEFAEADTKYNFMRVMPKGKLDDKFWKNSASAHYNIGNGDNKNNLGFNVERGKNHNNHYKESLTIASRDFLKDSKLIIEILEDLEKW